MFSFAYELIFMFSFVDYIKFQKMRKPNRNKNIPIEGKLPFPDQIRKPFKVCTTGGITIELNSLAKEYLGS